MNDDDDVDDDYYYYSVTTYNSQIYKCECNIQKSFMLETFSAIANERHSCAFTLFFEFQFSSFLLLI